ncbi:hydrogenase formation protein HypD [Clostridium zeae]|nr:hydrogenase formation protein HypD [Clostridium zeae]
MRSEVRKMQKKIRIMEICGTHTASILRSGIKNILPDNIELVSGPGCPVCVTPQGYIDSVIKLSERDEIIITTFGDMINIPGTNRSLKYQKALGCDIRVLYSPFEAVNIAKQNPFKEVVFLGIGFETTVPVIALAIHKAYVEQVKNFSVFTSLKTMPEVIKNLLKDKCTNIDGIIYPGHVSTIVGEKEFEYISDELRVPGIIAGFEDKDIMLGVLLLIDMISKNDCTLKNVYKSVVKYEGNLKAKQLINYIFEASDGIWRGFGTIKNSGLKIRNDYKDFDASTKFGLKIIEQKSSKGCICEDILRGVKVPKDCKLFGKECTPDKPVGVCMVSREGSCGVYFKYI